MHAAALLAQVIVPSGLTIVQAIVLIAILGVVAGLIDRATIIPPTFRQLIQWACIIAAVAILVLILLRAVGLA